MSEERTQDLATRAFHKRVLDEFAAVRKEQKAFQRAVVDQFATVHAEQSATRREIAELQTQQVGMANNMAALDQRVTVIEQHITSIDKRLMTFEQNVDARLKETGPVWEAVQSQLQRLIEKFDVVLRDIYDVRVEVTVHGRRIGELERRAS